MDSKWKLDKLEKKAEENEYIIEKGTLEDVDELENLYDALNDYLSVGVNYAGWVKGLYPVRETAEVGIKNGTLFVIKVFGEIAGSVILSHEPEGAYNQVVWGIDIDYREVIVIHTLAVHPKYMKHGIGRRLMEFIESYSIKEKMKTIRLDVSIKNEPAIALYERSGYKLVGTVDLGLNIPDLVWFRLYEIIL